MDIRMIEALVEALDMAYDALTMKVTEREMAATKAVVAMRRAQLRSDLRNAQRQAA